MPRFIAFLRGINVGGARVVTMDALRQAFEPLGFSGVATFIASGNVIFETPTLSVATLEVLIEKRLRAALGYEVVAFIRSDRELRKIADYQAFPAADRNSASELSIVFLATSLDAKTRQRIKAFSTESDQFHVHGSEIYWLRRRGPGMVYSTVPLDKALDRPFTIRSFRTIQKLAEKYARGAHT